MFFNLNDPNDICMFWKVSCSIIWYLQNIFKFLLFLGFTWQIKFEGQLTAVLKTIQFLSFVALSRSLWTQYVTYTISLKSINTNLKNTCEKTQSFNVFNIFNIFENNNSKSNQNLVFYLKSYLVQILPSQPKSALPPSCKVQECNEHFKLLTYKTPLPVID